MFTERQNLLLSLLREQGRSTGDSLAETLNVSKRTIYRDLGALIEAGVPIRTEGGPGGGIWIDEPRPAASTTDNGELETNGEAEAQPEVAFDARSGRTITIAEAEEAWLRSQAESNPDAEQPPDDQPEPQDAPALAAAEPDIAPVDEPAPIEEPAPEKEPVHDPIAAWFDAAFGRRATDAPFIAESPRSPVPSAPEAPVYSEPAPAASPAAAHPAVVAPINSTPGLTVNLAATVRERIYVDASGWWQEEMPSQVVVDLLQEAVFTNRVLRVQFHPSGADDGYAGLGATTRVIEPYGLIAKAGVWYLVSRQGSHFVADHLSRIASAEQLEQRFERVSGFDLQTWWNQSGAQFARGNENYRFTALVRKNRVEFLRMYVGGRLQVDTVDAQWARARLEVASPEAAVMIVLGLGQDTVVIEPDDLPLYVRRAAAGRPLHDTSLPARPTPSYALG